MAKTSRGGSSFKRLLEDVLDQSEKISSGNDTRDPQHILGQTITTSRSPALFKVNPKRFQANTPFFYQPQPSVSVTGTKNVYTHPEWQTARP